MRDPKQIQTSRKLTLTNTAVDAAQPGETLWDVPVPGLHLRVTDSKKAYYLYFRTKLRTERRPKLGDAKVLSLTQARENARKMLADVAGGGDPMADRTTAISEPTMDELWIRCKKEHWNRDVQWDHDAERLWTRNAAPKLGKLRVRAVTYDDVEAVSKALAKTPTENRNTIAVMSKMLNLAERWKYRDLGTNPCTHLVRPPIRKRRRFAKPVEIGIIGPLLEAEAARAETLKNKHTAGELRRGIAFLYILMFSGARPSEIERAKPEQLERVGDAGVLRIADGKTGHRDVFLPPQAMVHVNKLRKGTRTLLNCKMPRRLWERVRAKAGCADLWARDWRRTFATVGFSGGMGKDLVGDLLGHKSAATTNVYALLMEDPAFKASAEIAGRLETLLKEAPKPNENALAGGTADGVHDARGTPSPA